jgi:uncharacterized NAD(P)/FAD-binding protein YdhS
MVDLVLNLLDRGHRGRITALSRRGLLPHRHDEATAPIPWPARDQPHCLSALLHAARERAKDADWRAVVDGMRSHLQGWWQAMPAIEKRRFLRHLRPWWDIHRHRLAPEVADRLRQALDGGRLEVIAGQITDVRENDESVKIDYRRRHSRQVERLAVDRVVNCSGPCSDYARIVQPLVHQLLDDGIVRPDPLRLGLDVDDDLRLLDRRARPQARLYALGPVARGRFWECTAVPEIRRQAKRLAEHLISEPFLDRTADGAKSSHLPMNFFDRDSPSRHSLMPRSVAGNEAVSKSEIRTEGDALPGGA